MSAKPCIRCQRPSEVLRCLECPVCTQISSVLTFIYNRWNPDEIRKLADTLRSGTNDALAKDAQEKGAGMLVRLCETIRRLAFVANCETNHFKLRVADELVKQDAHQAKVAAWEEKNNTPGEFNRQAAAAIMQVFREKLGFNADQAEAAVTEPAPAPRPAAMTTL